MSKAKGIKVVVSHVDLSTAGFHREDGSLTVSGINALVAAQNSPIEHNTVDLGIRAFKRYLKGIPMLSKSQRNEQVREYKRKAREDYAELVKFKGSFPTMPVMA